jgi:4-hydroxybenzoyl-CoA thioesterase
LFSQRVRFQHCDPAGIIFYPRYFEMVNATVEEWFATRLGVSFAEIHGPMQRGVPTARFTAEFTAPSRLGEMLDWRLAPRRIGRASCELLVAASCGDEPRADFLQTLVWIDRASGRPVPWPDNLRARIQRDLEPGDESR